MLVYLEKELQPSFSNEHEVSEGASADTPNHSSETLKVTRSGRKIITPSRYKNYAVLLAGLITSQFVSFTNNEYSLNQSKQFSFFQAQLEHKLTINALPDGSNNSFKPLLFQAQESTNDTLC